MRSIPYRATLQPEWSQAGLAMDPPGPPPFANPPPPVRLNGIGEAAFAAPVIVVLTVGRPVTVAG